jgi:uncharacterized membrane protein
MEEQSLAWELLKDAKRTNKRQFVIILVILVMWFLTIAYLVYVLNDIGTVETTTQEISDVESIDNANVVNGDYNGNDKAN